MIRFIVIVSLIGLLAYFSATSPLNTDCFIKRNGLTPEQHKWCYTHPEEPVPEQSFPPIWEREAIEH